MKFQIFLEVTFLDMFAFDKKNYVRNSPLHKTVEIVLYFLGFLKLFAAKTRNNAIQKFYNLGLTKVTKLL